MKSTSWQTKRARYLFDVRDVRGTDAPLASATSSGVSLRKDLNLSVWGPSGNDYSSYKLVEPDDFVIGLRSFQHGIAHSRVTGLVSPAYTVFRGRAGVDPGFFRHYFRSQLAISALDNISIGIRQGRTVDVEEFRNLEFDLPPIEQQSKIARYLDARVQKLDDLVLTMDRQIAVLLTLQRAIIDSETRSVDEKQIPLKFVAQVVDTEHKTAPHVPNGGYWIAGTSAVRDGVLRQEELVETDYSTYRVWTRRRVPTYGDVLFSREAPVGEVGVYRRADPPLAIGQRMVLVSPYLQSYSGEYIAWNLMSSKTKRYIGDATQGSLHPHLNVAEIKSLPITVATPEKQADVVARLSSKTGSIRAVLARRERQKSLLLERRRAVITAAVVGKLETMTAELAHESDDPS